MRVDDGVLDLKRGDLFRFIIVRGGRHCGHVHSGCSRSCRNRRLIKQGARFTHFQLRRSHRHFSNQRFEPALKTRLLINPLQSGFILFAHVNRTNVTQITFQF